MRRREISLSSKTSDKKSKKMKKVYIPFLFISIVIISFLFVYSRSLSSPIKTSNKTIRVEVKEGQGFYDILDELDTKKCIRNKFMIKLTLGINHKSINLKPGIYEINNNANLDEFIEILEGKYEDKSLVKLTIPEGYSLEDIGEALEKAKITTKQEFIKDAENYEDIPYFVKSTNNTRYILEGYLYPDTYYIQKGMNNKVIIKMMLDRFEEIIKLLGKENNITIDENNISDIITKASIIEKEAKVEKDRKLISSVIDNRLNKKMKLQIDATAIYAINKKIDVVLYKHLKIDSPYNTYMYSGLPEGPICNPGKECIAAALLPDTTDYLYYILKKDGTHYFTSNYKDFLNKKKELGY